MKKFKFHNIELQNEYMKKMIMVRIENILMNDIDINFYHILIYKNYMKSEKKQKWNYEQRKRTER
ncbi:TPA: hypothetical protein DCZ39_05210 [Patescibacteria group bacterium]|nr:hypothetical protein [Candidatus Gracilibacteria bacterium]